MREMLLWTAWHVAALTRTKRLPRLTSILQKLGLKRVVRRSAAQLLRIAEHLNVALGGADKRKED